eukprot:CAMPEP_0182534358 /NCGR_PEP_ID=MMETSP1323-20130603/15594_1 /TAXON_ID=236787 /ORGANISM="Florenciella parvula, Strain RCC1693" /LENGTH=69 /DNA_ID=CAMNT_0024744367 /DNA_START=367 /DNA_END=576 /DNA_ORIENTATION=-
MPRLEKRATGMPGWFDEGQARLLDVEEKQPWKHEHKWHNRQCTSEGHDRSDRRDDKRQVRSHREEDDRV